MHSSFLTENPFSLESLCLSFQGIPWKLYRVKIFREKGDHISSRAENSLN